MITSVSARRQRLPPADVGGVSVRATAHDVNNLLAIVIAAAEAINRRRETDAASRADAGHILTAVQKAAALLAGLSGSGFRHGVTRKPIMVDAEITGLGGLLPWILGSKVKLDLRLDAPGLRTRIAPAELDRVIVNLAVNAAEAMPGGGTLYIHTSGVALPQPPDGASMEWTLASFIQITVADNGMGIPSELLARLFSAPISTKSGRGDRGLGLTIVRDIVRRCGGSIEVYSVEGGGTRLLIRLPVAGTPSRPTAAPVPPIAPTHQRTHAPSSGDVLLLVDDDDIFRDLVQRELRALGWHVLTAASADAALALVTADPRPRLAALLTDLSLPKLDGIELVQAVRACLAAPELPAIIMTGYATPSHLGVHLPDQVALLRKPFTFKTLSARLRALVPVDAPPR